MYIGTDILYIPRLKNIMDENLQFVKKVYTKKERDIAERTSNPLLFYATRFSGKEAIMKATGLKYDFNEIEILRDENGKPVAKILTDESVELELSLSYDNDYVVAFCIVK